MKASTSKATDSNLSLLQTGTCTQSVFRIMNQNFHNQAQLEERASNTLAGGIVFQGKICGLVIGASLGAGTETYNKTKNIEQSTCMSIKATQLLLKSFNEKFHAIDCFEITGQLFSTQADIFRYMLAEKGNKCNSLAGKWIPQAIKAIKTTLESPSSIPSHCESCASRVVRELGGTEKDRATVAGLAGGIGLSGNICGALTASLWYKSLQWLREHPEQKSFPEKIAKKDVEYFLEVTDGAYLCHDLSGKTFESLENHSNFIHEGGCNKLINILSKIS